MTVDQQRVPLTPARAGVPLGAHARRDAAVRSGAAAALWLGLLLVSSWWVADGGLQQLMNRATAWTAVGQVSGLWGSVLLLAQVLLMARVPLLERAFGQDRLAALHRLVGFTSFNLVMFHVATVTLGYAAGRLIDTAATFWNLTVTYPGMLLAVAATGCLVMVTVTSIRAARRRLRHESWHLLHLYAYLGVGLAIPHQLWTGQQFTASPTRTVFWWTAWAVTAATMLVWRVGRPVLVNLRHQLRVTGVVDEAPGIWSVHLTGRRLDRFPAEAGQFLSWRFLGRPGWTRTNPYSLSAAPDGKRLRITVQGVGDGSVGIRSLTPGTRAWVEGPYGRLTTRPRTRRRVAFIGAGVGTAPLRALADALPYAPGDALFLERCTTQPLFAAEVDRLAARRGLQVLRLPGHRRADGSWLGAGVGSVRQVDDLTALLRWAPDIAQRDVYLCGPEPWAALVLRTLAAAGVPPKQIHSETFGW